MEVSELYNLLWDCQVRLLLGDASRSLDRTRGVMVASLEAAVLPAS